MLDQFIVKHGLPHRFKDQALEFFEPFLASLDKTLKHRSKPAIIALNGTQGSGKTTLADYLSKRLREKHYQALSISLDDFYYPKQKRIELSESIHPLLATRGVPGTHEYSMLRETLQQVKNGSYPIHIPRFDKAIDDRVDLSSWVKTEQALDVLIVEGWCLGAHACNESMLSKSVNEIEARYDQDGRWRRYVNDAIKNELEPLYPLIDFWLMLKAPSFDCVFEWRNEQEEKLRTKLLNVSDSESEKNALMSPDEIAKFIQYFQRVTENILQQLPSQCDCVWELDGQRIIKKHYVSDRFL